MDIRGRWALVTGASSGIGRDVARELAARGVHCVLVARREERLRETARDLTEHHGVEAEIETADLGAPGAAAELYARLTQRGRSIDVLVNNAGFAVHGDFLGQDVDRVSEMIRVNVIALTELTHLFATSMAERGGGYVLNVASIAGLTPVPTYAAYAATKAYVVSLSESLAHELAPRNVRVTLAMPGVTWTEFFEVSGQKTTWFGRMTGKKSADVARVAVEALLKGRSSVITGWRNRLTMALSAPVPRHLKAWVTWQLNRND
jgi:hypothetical protein